MWCFSDGGADKRLHVKLEESEMTIADEETTTTTMNQQQPEMTPSSADTCLSRDLSQGDDVVSSTSDVLTGDYGGMFSLIYTGIEFLCMSVITPPHYITVCYEMWLA